jgi:hypothetical protein
MATEKDKILVDVEDLAFMIGALEASSGNWVPQRVRDALDYYDRSQTGEIQQWDIVEPKSGKNNLRAGNTAYGKAVVVSMSPFLLASEDQQFSWAQLDPKHFDIVGRAPMNLIQILNSKFGRYPIIG